VDHGHHNLVQLLSTLRLSGGKGVERFYAQEDDETAERGYMSLSSVIDHQ
jgi:hypothetical protein